MSWNGTPPTLLVYGAASSACWEGRYLSALRNGCCRTPRIRIRILTLSSRRKSRLQGWQTWRSAWISCSFRLSSLPRWRMRSLNRPLMIRSSAFPSFTLRRISDSNDTRYFSWSRAFWFCWFHWLGSRARWRGGLASLVRPGSCEGLAACVFLVWFNRCWIWSWFLHIKNHRRQLLSWAIWSLS